MTDKEIIDLWKQGYTIDQIVKKHPLTDKLLKAGGDDWIIRHRIEKLILKFMKGE